VRQVSGIHSGLKLSFFENTDELWIWEAPARCDRASPGQSGEGRKQFFFEKKNQKTFAYWARACGPSEGVKVFCFFFSKKKTFLSRACLHPIALAQVAGKLDRIGGFCLIWP
jgi:hypothetical protein